MVKLKIKKTHKYIANCQGNKSFKEHKCKKIVKYTRNSFRANKERKKRDKRRMTSTCGNTLKNHIEKMQRKSHQENTTEKCTTFVRLRCNGGDSWQWKRHRMVRRSSIYMRLRKIRGRKADRSTRKMKKGNKSLTRIFLRKKFLRYSNRYYII